VRNIVKTYENKPLLCGVSFTLDRGETVCLLGSSGSGKTTLLRIIAGLEEAEAGDILWDGQNLSHTPVHLRNFGLMFQDYALFPHRSVAENVAFGLRMQNLPKAEILSRQKAALEQVHMQSFANRRVTDLSGGEQQRVALARALAPRPRLLMLDEPLGALDRSLREQLLGEIRDLLHETQIPAIYVTHDQEEAFAIADRLALLHEGRIVQQGIPSEIYNKPANSWVARFLGLGNLVPGVVTNSAPLRIHTGLGEFEPASPSTPFSSDAKVCLLLRPSGALPVTGKSEVNTVTGMVNDVVFRGEGYKISLQCENQLDLVFHSIHPLPLHEPATFAITRDAILCLE
jgi:spermidine/putrescine transport system ATP-binding protein